MFLFCLCVLGIGLIQPVSIPVYADDTGDLEIVKEAENKEKEENKENKKNEEQKKKDNALKPYTDKVKKAQDKYNKDKTPQNKKALDNAKANLEKAEKDLNSEGFHAMTEDYRESHFGDFAKNLFSISIPLGSKNFDFTDLETSFENFIFLKEIQTWNIGGVSLWSVFKNLFSISIPLGSKNFDFTDLETSFENFIFLKEIQTWNIGGVSLWSVFKNGIYTVISSVATTLCFMFLILSIIKDCLAFDRFNWKTALGSILKAIIVVIIIQNAWRILFLVGNAFDGLVNESINKIVQTTDNVGTLRMGVIMKNVIVYFRYAEWVNIPLIKDLLQVIMELLAFIASFIIAVIYYQLLIQVATKVFQRLFKILFGMSIAPIPMAMTLTEGVNGNGIIRYIAWFSGTFLEGLIMLVAIKLYLILWTGVLAGLGTDPIQAILIVLVGVIFLNGLMNVIIEAGQQIIQQFIR